MGKTETTADFQLCPKFEKTFSFLGKRWNGLIIEVLLEEGTQRFGELATKIPEISDRVLAERLKELEANNVVYRREDELNSKKVEYYLTEKGQALENVMAEVKSWSDQWIKVTDAC